MHIWFSEYFTSGTSVFRLRAVDRERVQPVVVQLSGVVQLLRNGEHQLLRIAPDSRPLHCSLVRDHACARSRYQR